MSHRQYGKVAGHRLVNKFSPLCGNKLAAWPKAWVCSGSLLALIGSNPARDMGVSILCVLSRRSPYVGVDHSSRGVLPSAVCLTVITKHRNGRPWHGMESNCHRKKYGNDVHYRVNNTAPNIPILSRMKPVHVPKFYSYNTHCNTTSLAARPLPSVNIN